MLRRTLRNGLTALTHRSAAAPAVAVQVWVRVGSADEHDGELGLAHVHEHMLFKGTDDRPVGAIAAEVEAAGGDINAFTSFDQTVYHIVMSSRFFDRGLDVLADALQRSAFDPDELERELEVVLEEIKRSDDSAGRVAARLLFDTAFVVHPYRRPVIGTSESVRAFTRERILAFYRRWYTAQNLVVVAVGDLDENDAMAQIERAFADLQPGEPAPPRPLEPPQRALRVAQKSSRFHQLHLGIAFQAPALQHPDVAALDLLTLILGQGESSRLIQSVKRRLKLVNDISAYAYTPKDAGLLMLSAIRPPGPIDATLEAIFRECFRLCEERVSLDELEKARTIVQSQLVYERESVAGMARKLGYYESLAGGFEAEARYHERIAAASPRQLQEVARRYLRPDRMTVTALLPTDPAGAELNLEGVQAIAGRVFGQTGRGPQATPPLEATALTEATNTADIAPPLSPAVHAATLALEPTVQTLSSGLRLVTLRDSTVPLLSLQAAVEGGLLAEPQGRGGLARLTHILMNRGAADRPAAAFAGDLERIAARLAALSGRTSNTVRLDCLKAHALMATELFLDVIARPRFDADVVERERALQLELIRSEVDRPAARAVRTLIARHFDHHPFAGSVLGTAASVGAVTADDICALHHRVWQPARMVVSAVGDFDPSALVETLEDAFPVSQPVAPLTMPPLPARPSRSEHHLDGDGEQAHIALAFTGLRYADPRRPALDVLLTVLSGQGGRLFMELRDRQSLAYQVSASSFEGRDTGYLLAYMGTSPSKVPVGLKGLESVLHEITEAPITTAELDRARQYVAGTYDVALQRRGTRASLLGYDLLLDAPSLRFSHYTEQILAVTKDEVLMLAQELLDLNHATLCILGGP